MRKLTKDGRRAIVKDVLTHAFVDRIDQFLTMEKALVADLDARVYPKEIREKMDALTEFAESIDQPVFSRREVIVINVAGVKIPVGAAGRYYDPKSIDIHFEAIVGWCLNKTSHSERWIGVIACSNWSYDRHIFLTLEAGDELGDRVQAYYAERKAIHSEIKSQRGTIMGILAHIKNDKQLQERWPEVMPLAEKHFTEGAKVAQPPAIPTDDLNKMLGLPPETVQTDDATADVETETL